MEAQNGNPEKNQPLCCLKEMARYANGDEIALENGKMFGAKPQNYLFT